MGEGRKIKNQRVLKKKEAEKKPLESPENIQERLLHIYNFVMRY
jgi:hypothetical protein